MNIPYFCANVGIVYIILFSFVLFQKFVCCCCCCWWWWFVLCFRLCIVTSNTLIFT